MMLLWRLMQLEVLSTTCKAAGSQGNPPSVHQGRKEICEIENLPLIGLARGLPLHWVEFPQHKKYIAAEACTSRMAGSTRNRESRNL